MAKHVQELKTAKMLFLEVAWFEEASCVSS
jgi:hypothetical protein